MGGWAHQSNNLHSFLNIYIYIGGCSHQSNFYMHRLRHCFEDLLHFMDTAEKLSSSGSLCSPCQWLISFDSSHV